MSKTWEETIGFMQSIHESLGRLIEQAQYTVEIQRELSDATNEIERLNNELNQQNKEQNSCSITIPMFSHDQLHEANKTAFEIIERLVRGEIFIHEKLPYPLVMGKNGTVGIRYPDSSGKEIIVDDYVTIGWLI